MRILLAAHDSGALNIIKPILRAWHDHSEIEAWFISTPSVLREVKESCKNLRVPAWAQEVTEPIAADRTDLDALLERHLGSADWDAVICGTSRLCLLERRLLLKSRQRGIPSFAICDMWWAYRERFRDGDDLCLPDTLWVIDERMRIEAQAAMPELVSIEVVGNPFFEEIMHIRTVRHTERRAHLPIRFFSEPVAGKFPNARIDEFELAEWLLDTARGEGIGNRIIVRNHPLDSLEQWRRWAWRHRHHAVELDIEPMDVCMLTTGTAIGISSVVLLEMALCGIPAASLQLPDADPTYYCLPFVDFGISRIREPAGLVHWLTSHDDSKGPKLVDGHHDAINRIAVSVLRLADSGR